MNRMKKLWVKYINCSPIDSNERERQMNEFLNHCIISDSNNGLIDCHSNHLSVIVSIGNILINKLMCDIHSVCSHLNQWEDSSTPVIDYLSEQQIGSKLIQVIHALNANQSLLYNCELSYLLVHLLPILVNEKRLKHFISDINTNPLKCQTLRSINDCFLTLTSIQLKPNFNECLSPTKVKSWVKIKKSMDRYQSINQMISDSDDSEIKLYNIHVNKTPLISVSDLNNSSFDSNDEINHLSDTNEECERQESQLLPKVNSLQLFSLIIDILTEYAVYEQLFLKEDNGTEMYGLIPRVSYYICEELSDSIVGFFKLITEENSDLLVPVMSGVKNLLFISCCTLSRTPSGVKLFDTIKISEHLIEIMEYLSEIRNIGANNEIINIFSGLLLLMTSVCQYLNCTKEYAIVLKMIRLDTSHNAIQILLKNIIPNVSQYCDIESIVSGLKQLITALQRAKLLYVHRTNCTKKRHSKCNLSAILSHHNHILGTQVSNRAPFCCISSVYNLLILIALNTKSQSIQLSVTQTLTSIITCCCDFTNVCNNLLKFFIKTDSPIIRRDIFKIIENNIRNQNSDEFHFCQFCQNNSLNNWQTINDLVESSFSEGYITDNNSSLHQTNSESQQIFFSRYKLLLNSKDVSIRQLVSKHLLNLINYCSESRRCQLFQSVIMPSFFGKDTAPDVMQLLLHLMGSSAKDPNVVKMFIGSGGLSILSQLLRNSDYSLLAINVLEVLVINEIENHLNTNQSDVSLDESYSSLSTYLDIICSDTDNCVFLIKRLFVDNTINSLDSSLDSINLVNEDIHQTIDYEFSSTKLMERLQYVSNLWFINLELVSISSKYCQLITNPSLRLIDSIYNFFSISLDLLVKQIARFSHNEDSIQLITILNNIIELLLPVCLHLCPFQVSTNEVVVDNNQIMSLIKHQMSELHDYTYSGDKNPLNQTLNTLINCSLNISQVSSNIFSQIGKNKMKFISKQFSFDLSKDLTEEEDNCCDSGYDADIESVESSNSLIDLMSRPKTYLKSGKDLPFFKYSQLCRIVVQFLSSHKNSFEDKTNLQNVSQIFQKLIKYCKENPENLRILYEIDLISLLLNGFNCLLKDESKESRAVQLVILDLIVQISHFKICSVELKLFLQLFKDNSSQLDLCLNALFHILSNRTTKHNMRPLYCLSFPSEPLLVPSLNEDNPLMSSIVAQNRHSIVYDSNTQPSHLSWSSAAVAMPLPKVDPIFKTSNKSFSFAFWVYFDKNTDFCTKTNEFESERRLSSNYKTVSNNRSINRSQDSRVHMTSIAFEATTIEIWFDFVLTQFVYRICKLINGKNIVYSEDIQQNIGDLLGKWHLLRFNITEQYLKRSSSLLSICHSIDGITEQTVKLNFSNVIPKNAQSVTLLLGTVHNPRFRWQSGNLMLFRNSLSLESTLYLFCLGSDFCNFVDSKSSDRHRSPLILPKCLSDSNFVDIMTTFYELSKTDKSLNFEDNILIVYKPTKSEQFLVYSKQMAANNSYLPNLSKISSISSMRFKSSVSAPNGHDFDISEHKVIELAKLSPQFYYGVHKAVFDAGGVGIFMFLFAHIIDITSDEKMQSKALEIVLKVFDSDVQHRDMFINQYDGLSLISQLLETPKAVVSNSMLRNFMQFSVNSSESGPIITSSRCIATVISSWKAWHRNPFTIKTFYQTILSLISSTNPYKSFNIFQMKRANALQTIIFMIQEMYIQLNHRKELHLTKDSLVLLLKIIKILIGSPPDISLLSEIFDCVLLLHKAESAFISQSRNSFYYLFPSVWNLDIDMGSRKPSLLEPKLDAIDVEEWEVISEDEISLTEELADDCPDQMIAALISLMSDIIPRLSDEIVDKVVGPIIKLEFLIVLANNKSFKVRESVLTALYICVKRCKSSEAINQLIKSKGFHLMANQLHRYPASSKLLNICFGLILEVNDLSEFTFEDNFETKKCFNGCDAQLFVPLLAMLPKTVYDISLCHNSLQTFYRIMSSFNISFLREIYENGLLECLAKVLLNHNIYKHKIKSHSIDTIDGYEEDLINDDINNILREFSSLFFFTSGVNNHQIFCTALQFFAVLEKKVSPSSRQTFRECQIAILESAFDCIQFIAEETKSVGHRNAKLAIGANTAELFFNMFALPEENYESGSIGANNDNFDSSSFTSFDNSERLRSNSIKIQLHSKEIIDRFKDLIIKSIDFILFRGEDSQLNEKEKYFSRSILHIMSQIMESLHNEGSKNKKKNLWINILWHSRQTIQTQISRLVLYLISPLQSTEDRHFCISLITQFNCFTSLIKSNENFGHNFKAFLLDLIDTIVDSIQTKEMLSLIKVIDSQTTTACDQHYKESISDWFTTLSELQSNYNKSIELAKERALNKMKPLSRKVIESAISVTISVVEAQNKERKQYIYLLKNERTNNFIHKNMWKSIINQLTHEMAVWHFPDCYPDSWSLDPIEAPNRIRRKMKRCFLKIDDRFFVDSKGNENKKQLLSYIFNSDSTDSSAVIDRLHANERITYTSNASVITPDEEFPGEILISNSSIHFISEVKQRNDLSDNILTKVLPFDEIQEILKRRYQLQNNALEIFLTNGLTYLIAFESNSDREEFNNQIINKSLPNLAESKSLVALTQMWRERQLSNFEYLTHLNKISGRTFNDLMQYPIFPVILADYQSPVLDLTDSHSFRNLSKPMAIQKKSRENYYIEQYNYLKHEYERNTQSGEYMMAATTAPFHYGAHYSNSGTVLHFLVRLPPFTQMFLNYQDNNFDIPDRTFHSMATSWKLATSESTTDFKEFIPEFFFLPEFLMNNEKFDFGVRQNGERVSDVQLPAWSRHNARLFVLINRQSLESNYVTQNLHKWIDLVFGYKQTGKAAIEAINVFHPSTYYGTDVSKIEDPLKRMAIQTMIKTFGQMPRQLFAVPHPVLSQDVQLPNEKDVTHVIGEVTGLKWGSYVGSPSESEPIILLKKNYSAKISQFIALATNDVFAMPPKSTLFLTYSRQKGGALINTSYITSVALFLYSNPDSTIKIKIDSSTLSFNNATVLLDEITICKSVPNYDVLLVGYASGSINAYVIAQPLKSNQKIELKRPETTLYGHSTAIKSIAMSKSFTIAVTGDLNGVSIVWDLNCFCYVRTLAQHNSPIELLAISETLGDIVAISHHLSEHQMKSSMFVHTINGDLVGHVITDSQITAVCYSTAPEGLSVNVMATAFSDGSIKLWSTWDLSPVRQFRADIDLPIICMSYTNDNQLLYVLYSDNTVVVWENSHKKGSRNISLTLL